MKINSGSIGDLFVNLFMCLLGLMIAISMAYKIFDYVRFQNQSTEVEGVVTDVGCSGYFGCKPFIEYVDAGNQVYEFRSKHNYYFFASPEKGDKVQVCFLNSDHQKAIISNTFYGIFQPLYFFLIGLVVIIILVARTVKANISLTSAPP